ncbi:MAG: RDD family protein [Promethearchaeota archaeon]
MSIPTTWLLAFEAIIYGSLALFLCIVIFGLIRIIKNIRQGIHEYKVNFSTRFAAFIIDIIIISMIVIIIKGRIFTLIEVTQYGGVFYLLIDLIYLIILSFMLIVLAPLLLIISFPFLLIYTSNLLSSVFIFIYAIVLPNIIAFVYFFVLETFFDGRTIGKAILGIKSVSGKENRSITPTEAATNAFAKSFFLLLDIIFGAITKKYSSHQFRWLQQQTDVWVVRTKISVPKSDAIFCTECGYQLVPDAAFCVRCGSPVPR